MSKNLSIYVPKRGPRVYNAIAVALSRSANRSPTDPPPIAIDELPKKPAEFKGV
jgi:hypothetical protein